MLFLYDRAGDIADTITSSSYTSSTATFPASSLGSLTADMYGAALVNGGANGLLNYLGSGWVSIGHDDQSYPGAFGVASQVVTTAYQAGSGDPDPYGQGWCLDTWTTDSSTWTDSHPVVTEYSLNMVKNGGFTIPVGNHPTAIAIYDSETNQDYGIDDRCNWYEYDTTQMTRAVVANSSSNTVSVLDLVNNTVLATITVGSQPIDVRVSPDKSKAYIVNYGSGTISKVNLSTYSVTATTFVGAQPAAIDLDANGDPVVGGSGYIVTLDPNSLGIISNQQTSGGVTALAVSKAKNQILTSTISGSGSGETATMIARNVPQYSQAFSTGPVSDTPYTQSGISSSLSFPSQLASGIIVSPVLNNGFAAVATSAGFQITDLETGQILLSGNTPHPVRGMAIDPAAGYFYFTMPDSNSVVTVPIPTVPLDPNVTFLN